MKLALPRLAVFVALIASVTPTRPAASQELQQTVEAETFFFDEPAWVLAFRPALGYSPDNGFFPQMAVGLGYDFPNHFYVGGNLATRFTYPGFVRLEARVGVFYRDADFAFGTGVSPGIMYIPYPRQFGFLLTWGLDARYRITQNHYLTLFGELDLLFDKLGFRSNTWQVSGGLGWTILF